MKRLTYLLFLIVSSSGFCFSQGQNVAPGKVSIIADPRIDRLVRMKTEEFINDSTSQGYRIQIYSDPQRKMTMQEEERFRAMYPHIPIYIKYDNPNFKLRVGDYQSRLEAQYLFFQLVDSYPRLFIVPDRVNPLRFDRIYF